MCPYSFLKRATVLNDSGALERILKAAGSDKANSEDDNNSIENKNIASSSSTSLSILRGLAKARLKPDDRIMEMLLDEIVDSEIKLRNTDKRGRKGRLSDKDSLVDSQNSESISNSPLSRNPASLAFSLFALDFWHENAFSLSLDLSEKKGKDLTVKQSLNLLLSMVYFSVHPENSGSKHRADAESTSDSNFSNGNNLTKKRDMFETLIRNVQISRIGHDILSGTAGKQYNATNVDKKNGLNTMNFQKERNAALSQLQIIEMAVRTGFYSPDNQNSNNLSTSPSFPLPLPQSNFLKSAARAGLSSDHGINALLPEQNVTFSPFHFEVRKALQQLLGEDGFESEKAINKPSNKLGPEINSFSVDFSI